MVGFFKIPVYIPTAQIRGYFFAKFIYLKLPTLPGIFYTVYIPARSSTGGYFFIIRGLLNLLK